MRVIKGLTPEMGFWESDLRKWGCFRLGCDLRWSWYAGVLTIGWN